MSEMSRALDLRSERATRRGPGDPFGAAFRDARSAMLLTDPHRPDNPIVLVNQAFLDLTGYAREEVVGRNCRFLQGPDTDGDAVARVRDALRAGEGIDVEILNYRKDGTSFWNALAISPVRSQRGDLVHFFASQHDVGDKRRAEEELQRARERLDEAVENRTRDLRAALDRTTTLLHEVDHRVKNSLQVVSSLVLLKVRRLKDPSARRALANMGERIAALATVHRLLHPVGEVSRFDLGEFVADLAADLTSGVPSEGVTLDFAVEPMAVSAGKAAPLALLLNELIGNALQHAFPDGRSGRVAVEVTRHEAGLRIVVEDDGIGLSNAPPASEESFGRTLIEMLVRQLKAEIAWEDAGPGTRVVVTAPVDAVDVHP